MKIVLKPTIDKNEFLENVNPSLWNTIEEYMEKSSSVGCNSGDYSSLYNNIKKYKFTEVLECGSGVTTVAIAQALYDNMKETGVFGRVTSMESEKLFFDQSVNLLPDHLKKHVDFVLSPTCFGYYSFFRGMKYKNKPDRQYDFCWIDGPWHKISDDDGRLTFSFDFIDVLKASKGEVCGMVDGRYTTVFVLQIIVKDKLKTYNIEHSGYDGVISMIDPVSVKTLKRMYSGEFYIRRILKDSGLI